MPVQSQHILHNYCWMRLVITGIIKDKVSIISAMPKAEANKTYQDLNYLGYHKNCLIIHCFEKK